MTPGKAIVDLRKFAKADKAWVDGKLGEQGYERPNWIDYKDAERIADMLVSSEKVAKAAKYALDMLNCIPGKETEVEKNLRTALKEYKGQGCQKPKGIP